VSDAEATPEEATAESTSVATEAAGSEGGGQLDRALAVVTHLAVSLVDDSDAVTTAIDDSYPTPRINVSAAEGEIGRLIGKRGRTAMAIRAVGRAAAAKDGGHVDVEFLD
jgi:predicted RNA-binding protein YlqC (UPF0109 family)